MMTSEFVAALKYQYVTEMQSEHGFGDFGLSAFKQILTIWHALLEKSCGSVTRIANKLVI